MSRPPLKLERWGNITITETKPYTASCWYRDATGKRRRMRRIGRTKAIARANLEDALRDELTESDSDITPASTLTALGEIWWTEYSAGRRAHNTIMLYRRTLATITEQIGDLRIREATVPKIDRYLKAVAASSGPSAARVRRTVLAHMLELAIRHGATNLNTARLSRPPSPDPRSVEAPDAERINIVRDHLAAYDARPTTAVTLTLFADLLIATGTRTSELLALRWEDVDLDAGAVDISGTLTRDSATGKLIRQDRPKSDHGRRRLQLPAFAVALLLEARTQSHTGIVFPSSTGTQWSAENLRRSWRAALAGTTVEGTTPRAFRKAVATALDRAIGADAAGKQLGHSDATITKAYYIERLHDGPDARLVLERLRQGGQ